MSDLVVRVGSDLKAFQSGAGDMEKALVGIGKRAEGLGGTLSRLVGGPMTSLIGKLSGVGLASEGLRAIGDAAVGLGNALGIGLNAEMEDTRATLMAFYKDSGRVEQVLADVRAEASKTPFAFNEMATAASGLGPAAKQAREPLMNLIKDAEILAASNPAEGLKGAAFALKEAVSGDFTSVIERFNLPRSYINKLKEEGVPALEVVRRAMQEMGLDASLVENRAKTMTGRWSTFLDTLDTLRQRLSEKLFAALSSGLENLQGFLDANIGTLNAWADAAAAMIGNLATGAGRVIEGLQFVARGIGEVFDETAEWTDALQIGFERIFGIGSPLVGVLMDIVFAAKDLATFVGERVLPVLSALFDYFRTTAETGDFMNDFLADLEGPLRIAAEAVGLVIANASELITMIGELAEAARLALGGDFAGAFETAQRAVGEWFTKVSTNVRVFARDLMAWLSETAPRILEQLGAWGQAFVDWIRPRIDPMLAELGRLRDEAFAWIGAQAQPILEQLGKWGQAFVDWIGPAADKFVAEWPSHLTRFLDWIEFTAAPAIVGTLSSWIDAFVAWIGGEGQGGAAGGVFGAIGRIAEVLYRFIEGTAAVLGPRLAKWANAFLGWIAEKVIPELPGILWAIVTKIGELVLELAPRIFEAAKGLGLALARGIIAGLPAPDSLKNWILSFLGGATSAAQLPPPVAPPSQWTRPPPGSGVAGAWVNGVPQLAAGGIVTSSGLAVVHAAEVVGPLESVRGTMGGGIDYGRLARAIANEVAGLQLSVSVDDVHGALIRKSRRNAGLAGLGIA